MNSEARYRALISFLLRHQSIWFQSILQNWPASQEAYPEAWLAWIEGLDADDQRAFGDEQRVEGMPTDLLALLRTCAEFCEWNQLLEMHRLDDLDIQGLNLKKQHEIQRLLPLLAREAGGIKHAVDIGGGMGHLARLCVKTFGWTFHSIDKDAVLQEKGRWWLKRSRGLDREKLRFVNATFSDQAAPDIDRLFAEPSTLSLGLHTCGPLALSQFQKSLESRTLVNFGCCYDKMDRTRDLNQSRTAKELNLPWSQAALFLATRSRKGMTDEEFTLLKRVNAYRFSFDLYIRQQWPELGFVIAGDAPKALYLGSFATYALDRITHLKLDHEPTGDVLESFYRSPSIQKEATAIFAAHLIRNLFARPLEIAILLDRALWLEEHGFAVELLQVFDRQLSPRNIALVARSKAR
ncbi:MAG: methyltransferase [Chitinophagaceae bacterium]|nr:methyltransferase [Oligoflexus sp.]